MRVFVLNVSPQFVREPLPPPLSVPTMNFGEEAPDYYEGPLRPPTWDDVPSPPTTAEPQPQASDALPPPMSAPSMF